MSPDAMVSRFRISAIWAGWTPQILESQPAEAPPLRKGMSGPAAYAALFDSVRAGVHPGIDVPWGNDEAHQFWREFCTRPRDELLGHVVPRQAARHLVPLHARGLGPSKEPWKLSLHYFLYPFGVALLLHGEYPHPDLDSAADVRLPLRDVVERCYDLRGDDEASAKAWAGFVDQAVADASAILGAPLQMQSPLTVVTFIQVADVLKLDPAERDQVLNALTGWPQRNRWPDMQVDPPPAIDLAPRRKVKGRHVHAARRGRSLWFPDGFAGGATLSDDHRRLCFMTMQTEMLIRFMSETAGRLQDLPPVWDLWASKGARTIGLVYGDDQIKAWDSSSPRVQIDHSDAVPAINRVREHYSRPENPLPPLHA